MCRPLPYELLVYFMYYANNENDIRVDIDNAVKGECYYCPVCNNSMIIKRGKIVSPHFAHKSNVHCDPWYVKKMSYWHRRMQNKFPPNMREVALWNDDKTEFHIADALIGSNGEGTVFEFQHSNISVNEFLERTQFYMNIGYSVVWIFDYQHSEYPKCMYYQESGYSENVKRVTWPGRDRVRMFDSEVFRSFMEEISINTEGRVTVLFHVNTGLGKLRSYRYQDCFTSYKWEYLDPISREPYFIKPYFLETDNMTNFLAAFFTENEIDKQINKMVTSASGLK